MKHFVYLFLGFYSVLFSSCALYYQGKEQSVYIPNVANHNSTLNHKEFSNSTFIGFNHMENQSNFMFNEKITLQNNYYFSKGFRLMDLGISYRKHVHGILNLDLAPGVSYGYMNYMRERKYLDGGISPGYSDNVGHVKTENISYSYCRAYFDPSFTMIFKNKFKLFVGARLSYADFLDLDYYFKDITKKYSQPEEVNSLVIYKNNSLIRAGIEPHISLHLPYKQVGVFFQVMYYGPIGNDINVNTYHIMNKATIPFLISVGFTLNPYWSKEKSSASLRRHDQ